MASYMLPALAGARPVCFPSSPAPISPMLRRSLGVEDRTAGGLGYALTFDDGPHPQGTPAVLEILRREQVTATFFLVGEQVLRNPALAREIADAGHHVAVHCQRHRNLLRLSSRQTREDIAGAYEVDRRVHRLCAAPVSPALRHPQRLRAAPGPSARLAHAAVEPLGPGLGGARHARLDRRARYRRRR